MLSMEDRARLVCDRLRKASSGQFLFMVYNPMNHWVLVVIDVTKKEVFYMDPLNNELEEELKDLIISSMKVFSAQDGPRKWSYTSMVKNVQVPQQLGAECGYYVLRFMIDVMEDINVLSKNFYGKLSYDQSELDFVREEWASHISHVISLATSEAFVAP